ncbi:MAG: hypothetical protein ACRDIC_04405 [bacterium]
MALLIVLVILLAVSGASSSFIWLMNQQQTRAGLRMRNAAAAALAEAGVHRALAILEGAAPGGARPGREWRPADYTEEILTRVPPGRFTVSIIDDPDGAVLITSTGEVAGAVRKLRARTYLASPALLAALYGPGIVHFQRPPAATYILPYGRGLGDRPWVHIAAGREVWFGRSDVALNQPAGTVELGAGPADPVQNPTRHLYPPGLGPVRMLLARGAHLTVGGTRLPVDVQQLRAMGLNAQGVLLRAKTLPPLPEVAPAYFQDRAAANMSNAALNASAGTYVGNADLKRKRDSLYSPEEFDQLQIYLGAISHSPRLSGIIYVKGALLVADGQHLRVSDGALIVEGAVYISPDAVLEITHSLATRRLPGLIALNHGIVAITGRARVRIHGLVYASKAVAVDDDAHVDVVGAVLTGDPSLSFRNTGGQVVVRYDPAVLGTPGLRVPAGAPVVAWVAAWEELP